MHHSDIFNQNPAIPNEDNQIYSVNGKPSFRIMRRPQPNCAIFPKSYINHPESEATPLIPAAREPLETVNERPAVALAEGAFAADELQEDAPMTPSPQDDFPLVNEPVTPPPEMMAQQSWPLPESSQMGASQDAGDSVAIHRVRDLSPPPVVKPVLMYQYRGSNIQRNPLTGSGITEEIPKTGKRMSNKFGYKIID